MKRLFFNLFIFTASIFKIIAQDFPIANVENNLNTAEIEFNKTIYDYGKILNGADGMCEFKFKNSGNESLRLTSVRSSSGCTVPKYTQELIPPGKTGIIQVKYDTKRIGIFNKQITVNSNAKNSTVTLYIKGEIASLIEKTTPLIKNDGATPKTD